LVEKGSLFYPISLGFLSITAAGIVKKAPGRFPARGTGFTCRGEPCVRPVWSGPFGVALKTVRQRGTRANTRSTPTQSTQPQTRAAAIGNRYLAENRHLLNCFGLQFGLLADDRA